MSRPYLIGWYYAFQHLWQLRKRKNKWYMWKQLLKKKYYWLTPEERVEAIKKCFNELRKINISKVSLDNIYD